MNDKAGTVKLLCLAKDRPSAKAILSESLAVRLGSWSSSVLLVDGRDPVKLLLCQVTYTDADHVESCLTFLASGERNAEVQQVCLHNCGGAVAGVTRTEFARRLPELEEKMHPANFAQQVIRSAAVIFDIQESLEDFLYPTCADESAGMHFSSVSNWMLVDSSSEFGIRVAKKDTDGQWVTQDEVNSSIATRLSVVRQSLADLMAGSEGHQDSGESFDTWLAFQLHNAVLDDKSEQLKSALAQTGKLAVPIYTELIANLLGQSQATAAGLVISDSIFCTGLCREALVKEWKAGVKAGLSACKAIRFVQDAGLLGFIGSLVVEDSNL